MPEPSFFPRGPGLTVGEIAAISGARLGEGTDPAIVLSGMAPLDRARSDDLSFFDNPRYAGQLAGTGAGCVVVAPKHLSFLPEGLAHLVAENVQQVFAAAGRRLFPAALVPASVTRAEGISPSADIDPSAEIEDGVTINNLLPGSHDTDRIASLDAGAASNTGVTAEEARAARQAGIPVFYTAQRGDQLRADRGLQADLWGPGMRADPEHEAILPEIAPRSGDHVLVTRIAGAGEGLLVNETLTATHTLHAPWHLIPNDNKQQARAAVAQLLGEFTVFRTCLLL